MAEQMEYGQVTARMEICAGADMTFEQAVKHGVPNTPENRRSYAAMVGDLNDMEARGVIADTMADGA